MTNRWQNGLNLRLRRLMANSGLSDSSALQEYIANILRQNAKDHHFTEQTVQQSTSEFTPDLTFRDADGNVVVIEIKQNVATADVARLAAVTSKEANVKAVLFSDSDTPQELKEFANNEKVKIVEGWSNTAEVI